MLGQPINQPQLCKSNDTSLDLLQRALHLDCYLYTHTLYVANIILNQLSTLQVSPLFSVIDNRVTLPQVKQSWLCHDQTINPPYLRPLQLFLS